MSKTILNDKQHRDLHVVSGLITLLKLHGPEWCKHAIGDLTEYVAANDTHPCPPGTTWNGKECVDDLPK